ASRNAQSPLDAPSSTTIITRQDIELSGITRIPELLRRVAGMDVMEITGGDTNVSMRGFNSRLSNKLLVLVNGRSVYNDILGSTFWETFTIDVDQIERIEVVRGPGSALYGADAFAGVVNIITIAPGEGRSGARAGYGDHEQGYGSVWVSGRDGDFAYRASAGYTRYPRWSKEVDPNRIDLSVADFNQNLGADNERVDLRTSRRLGKDMSIDVGGGFARGDLDVYGIGPFNDYVLAFENSDVTADFRSKHVNLRAYWARLHANTDSDYQYLGHTLYPSVAEQNSVDGEAEYTNEFVLPEGVRHEIHVGAGYRMKKVDWNYLAPDTPVEHHVAGYAEDSAWFGKHVSIFASGRVDYVPYLQRAIGSPRGAIIVKPTDRQVIRLSGSTAFRSPTFLESYLQLPIQLPLPGAELFSASKAPDEPGFILQPEQITTAEIDYQNQQSDYFEVELNAYYNRVTDLVELAVNRNETLSNKQQGIGGYDPATGRYGVAFGGWDNQCDAYNVLGGELGFRVYPVEGLDLFANYALNLSSQTRPAGCDVPEDKRTSVHKVNAGVQVRTHFGINGEITFHYQSSETWNEQVATVDRGIVYESFPLPAYTLLNAKVGYRFYKDKAEVSATVFNALADAFGPPPQQHPFGNRIGRRVMGFLSYQL
ncbi:MAG TPA: TonB-dependent receptor, partial [Minicystis sp.]|nr:TonB-dependent receptor [Minicystis sp.]